MRSDSVSVLSKAFLLLLTGALVIVALLAMPTAAFAQAAPPYVLNHFRCYSLVSGPPPDKPLVTLEDQFDIRRQIEEDVWVGLPTRFCNPVTKRIENPRTGAVDGTPISDPDAHLTMYRIRDRTIHRPVSWNVVVSNQFGTQKVVARRPRFLAVPTQKLEADLEFPERLDHFKCYEAYGKEIVLKVTLNDQFEQANVVVLDPKLFCNPTRKTDTAGVRFGVQSAHLHLTCYDLIEVPTGPFSFVTIVNRLIRNQFTTTGPIEAYTDEDLLCVPSRKVSYNVVGPGGPEELTILE
jgi:hypothetical protein